jgi:hypothetical protein
MARQRLPNRRHSETFELTLGGLKYTVTLSRFADGRIGELFLTNHKSASAADQLARDAGIVFSIAVQCGADPEVIERLDVIARGMRLRRSALRSTSSPGVRHERCRTSSQRRSLRARACAAPCRARRKG